VLGTVPPEYVPEAIDAFFLYSEPIILKSSPAKHIASCLSNLGYIGDIEEKKSFFAKDYDTDDEDRIVVVHSSGMPRKRA
jgi:hypothetical protein